VLDPPLALAFVQHVRVHDGGGVVDAWRGHSGGAVGVSLPPTPFLQYRPVGSNVLGSFAILTWAILWCEGRDLGNVRRLKIEGYLFLS